MFGGYSEHMGNDPNRNVLGVVDRAIATILSDETIDQLVESLTFIAQVSLVGNHKAFHGRRIPAHSLIVSERQRLDESAHEAPPRSIGAGVLSPSAVSRLTAQCASACAARRVPRPAQRAEAEREWGSRAPPLSGACS